MVAVALPSSPPLSSPNRPIDAVDVLPILRRLRHALHAALVVPKLARVDEQRFSAVYIGVVDLDRRLRQVARMCQQIDAPQLMSARAELLRRTTTAVELLETLTSLHCIDPDSDDIIGLAAPLTRRIATLQARYGRALFA